MLAVKGNKKKVVTYLTIWLDSMLKAVQFPASVTDLDTSLTNMD